MIEYLSPIAQTQARLERGRQLANIDNLSHWLPVALTPELGLSWRWIGAQRLQQPFFADEFKAQPIEQRQFCHTSQEQSRRLLQSGVSLSPAAIIFHSSRCGSTLLMQLLACLPQCLSLSEAPLLEHGLHALHHGAPPALLQLLLQALMQRRFAQEKYAILKPDCWHLFDFARLQEALPDCPKYFLYRTPEQVLASHMRQRGPQMIPGLLPSQRLGFSCDVEYQAWPAWFLQQLFHRALQHAKAGELQLLNYRQLPDLLWDNLLPAWRIALEPGQLAQLQERSTRHAKHGQAWQGDPHGTAPAPPALQAAYEALEDWRISRQTPALL
ncbi:hypothetical protein V8J88_22600 [Massilia sp. W12]|uniref:hypothetical protein n=1 Tax=Massilia sp. W12 TaxID=3126507 RepID=UPI0030D4D101